jgi:trigger factor
VNVTVTDVSELRKDLVVALSADEVSQEETAILNEFRKHAKVPGFRPGKAPANIIRQRYGKELKKELGQKIANKAFQDAIQEKGLTVYNVVSLEGIDEVKPGAEATLDITVDLAPTFELPEYMGYETTAPGTDVEDSEIDDAITNIRRQRAAFNVVEREAAAGDYVQVTYKGSVGDQPIKEIVPDVPANKSWAEIEKGWEEAGTDEAKEFGVPEVIDALVGMKAGDEKEVSVTFAEDFKIEELRGKTATYAVSVHEVRERVLPELNEEFFKSLQVESEEDLKARLLDNLENQKKQKQRESQRQQVIDRLLEQCEFPLPESGVQAETQSVMGRIMVENLQRGVPQEEFEQNKEALHAQATPIAERDLKLQFILSKIAEKEGIEVSQEDLQRAILMTAQQRRMSPDDFVKELRKDQNQIRSMQRQILLGKSLDFVVGKAKLTVTEGGSESA